MNSHTIQGATWYTTAAYYPTRAQARAAWARANEVLREDSSLDIGLTSLSPGGTASFGKAAPPGVFPVVGITRSELAARKVERKLREATRFRPSDESAAALAARHVRLSIAHHGPTAIRRAEDNGGLAQNGTQRVVSAWRLRSAYVGRTKSRRGRSRMRAPSGRSTMLVRAGRRFRKPAL